MDEEALWENPKNYVLLFDRDDSSYTILQWKPPRLVLIEEPDEEAEIVRRLIDAGVQVVEELPDEFKFSNA